jgi:hypothetical protein
MRAPFTWRSPTIRKRLGVSLRPFILQTGAADPASQLTFPSTETR